jgi:hypothetical protein
MNAQQLKRQLLREMKAHPAKAGLLMLLAVVAALYWAPIILGGLGGDATEPGEAGAPDAAYARHSDATAPQPASTADAMAMADGAAGPAVGSPATTAPTAATQSPMVAGQHSGDALRWLQLLNALQSDALHQPQHVAVWLRDPFQSIPPPLVAPPPTPLESIGPVPPSTGEEPQQVAGQVPGLQLHGTIIGARQQAALIGHRAYRQGRWIDDGAGGRLQVVRIEPRSVVLRRGDEEIVLEMQIPQQGGIVEIQSEVD